MNQLAGKKCPFCNTELHEDDSIVVCSECEMPHHKDCWIENQGCTTFGCGGTIQFPDPATMLPSESCELANEAPNIPVPPVYVHAAHAETATGSGANEYPLIRDFIGPNADFYIARFNLMQSSGKSRSWNWAAFLFAPFWCAYRKLYGIGFGILAGTWVLAQLDSPGWLILIIGYIVFGFHANHLYQKRILHLVHLHDTLITAPFKAQFVQKNGGIQPWAVVLFVVGLVIFPY